MKDHRIVAALRLLQRVKTKELSTKEAVQIIELVTSVPELIKEVLRRAEGEGLIKKEGGRIHLKAVPENFDLDWHLPRIKRTRCQDNCKRCGRRITHCHFIILEDLNLELGPLGSECVRKLKLV